jgi:hypothetical protein
VPLVAGKPKGTGRLFALDTRDGDYLARMVVPVGYKRRKRRTWSAPGVSDQGAESSCTGWGAWAVRKARPRVRSKPDPMTIYRGAREHDEWPGECVDTETSCLSKRGWLSGDTLQVGDEIAVLDLSTEHLRWARVDAVHRFEEVPYRVWQNDQFECAVTDNHKWVVKNRLTHAPLELVETQHLKSQHATLRSVPGGLLTLPETESVHDDMVRLVSWSVTEGYYRPEFRGRSVVISQKSHRSAVMALMQRLGVAKGYEKQDGCYVWEVSGSLALAVREAAPEKAPTMEWLSSLTLRQLRLFIDTCMLGDGSATAGGKWGRQDRSVYYQNPSARLDSFLAACVLAGLPVSRSSVPGPFSTTEGWSLRKSSEVDLRKLIPSPYAVGRVWCPQTKYGTFVARRGRAIFITGNSYEGSSVRGACEFLLARGLIKEYRWSFTVTDLLDAIDLWGPAVIGIDWPPGMHRPKGTTMLHGRVRTVARFTGEAGNMGHALAVVGYDEPAGFVDLKNSHSVAYGDRGRVLLSLEDMEAALRAAGEAATFLES